MKEQLDNLNYLGQLISEHGTGLLLGLVILISGLYFSKWAAAALKRGLGKTISKAEVVSIIANAIGILMATLVIIASSITIGADLDKVIVFILIIDLAAVGILVLFRPLLPKLPFKAGNTVKFGNLLGVVEETTALNTRLRTFDGKTFFVPNRKILDDIVINYHFTQSRRIKIDVTIGYDQDLAKAKKVLEELMISDARVQPKPSPMVFVLNLGHSGVELGGRCWVDNKKYWVTRCELNEKVKFRFDREKILFAYPKLEIYLPNCSVQSKNDARGNGLGR